MSTNNKGEEVKETLVCINLPEHDARKHPHTSEELALGAENARASRIAREFDDGLKFIRKYKKSVTVYGSARFTEDNPHYIDARALGARLAKLGYAVVTGGGPGIMEAANRGAKEAGGDSIGLNIELPSEQILNPYTTDALSFYYFFSRKTTMSFSCETYIFYPGGFGTLDEFFEIVTLIQTKKIRPTPIVLIGKDFWEPLNAYIKKQMIEVHATINKDDLDLYTITDDHAEVERIVLAAPIRS